MQIKTFHFIILIIAAILIGFFISPFTNKDSDIISSYEETIDSIAKIASTIPLPVIKSDTVYVDKIVYVTKSNPKIVDSGNINTYTDTTDNEDLLLVINDKVDGYLMHRNLNYKLKVPKIITDSVIIYKSVPVFVDKPSYIEYKSYLTGGVGIGHYYVTYGRIIRNRHLLGLTAMNIRDGPKLSLGISYTYLIK